MNEYTVEKLSDYINILREYPSENFAFRGENAHHELRTASVLRHGFRQAYFRKAIDEYYSQVAHRIFDIEKESFLAFAQHHGLHTNLIDITSAPLVALFMACYGASELAESKAKSEAEKQKEWDWKKFHQEAKGYVYIFNKENQMDITDIISKFPLENILTLFASGNVKVIQNLYEIIKKYSANFTYRNKPIGEDLIRNLVETVTEDYRKDFHNNPEIRKGKSMCSNSPPPNGVIWMDDLKAAENYCDYETLLKRVILNTECLKKFPQIDFNNDEELELYFILLFYGCNVNPSHYVNFFPTMIYKPKISFERSRIQQGYFFYQMYPERRINNIWNIQEIKHDEVLEIKDPKTILTELDNIGINYGTLFGDFDSIAKYIREK